MLTTHPLVVSGLSTTVVVVSRVPKYIDNITIFNPGNAGAYVQFFDAATPGEVQLGTTVPVAAVGVTTLGTMAVSGLGWSFQNGIQVAATTTPTGSSAPNVAQNLTLGITL